MLHTVYCLVNLKNIFVDFYKPLQRRDALNGPVVIKDDLNF